MDVVFQYGLQGVLSFGGVGALSIVLSKYFHKELDSDIKLGLLILLFFLVGFVPADLGNDLLNRIKLAVAAGVVLHGLWTIRKA